MAQSPVCPRWRLVLDRPVALRGVASGQTVRTTTVYVARGKTGCGGAATLQIPRPVQPATLPQTPPAKIQFVFSSGRFALEVGSPGET